MHIIVFSRIHWNTDERIRFGCSWWICIAAIIMIGKAWVRSMRAFRMVGVVLLQNFHRHGEKTFSEISAYMDEVRKHPTGIQ